jgi:hypothetical protein
MNIPRKSYFKILAALVVLALTVYCFYPRQRMGDSEVEKLCGKLASASITAAELDRLEKNVDRVDATSAIIYYGLLYRASVLNPRYLMDLRASKDAVRSRVLQVIEKEGVTAYQTLIACGYEDPSSHLIMSSE